jgi:hypothetical protein
MLRPKPGRVRGRDPFKPLPKQPDASADYERTD